MAGIFSRFGDPLLDADIDAIQKSISRPGDPIQTFRDSRFFLAKLDLGCFGGSAFITNEVVATATGELFLSPQRSAVCNRSEDLLSIISLLREHGPDALRQCVGTYSLCLYDPSLLTLTIATDRMGCRAVYYCVSPTFVYFSSNLRVLEAIASVPKEMDIRATMEMLTFGVPLADRTPFTAIKNLRGGEAMQYTPDGLRLEKYFHWRDLAPSRLGRKELLDLAHETFLDAIECRAARDVRAVSFLSGGLDSRVIVAGLHELGKDITSVTFAYPHLQDGVIAARFAEALGVEHVTIPVSHRAKGRILQATQTRTLQYPEGRAPRHPGLVFSGDGGSVGVGFVYMDKHLVRLLRAEKMDEAITFYLRNKSLPTRLFKKNVLPELTLLPALGVREELLRSGTHDPAKDFHVFLLDNDQRRHLHYVYEHLDNTRTEFLLPFMDGRFLDLINSAQVDWFLLHAFYNEWLKRFPEPTFSIPWQAYPGHVPCPIKSTAQERTQWNLTRSERFAASDDTFQLARRAIRTSPFPGFLINRPVAALGMILHGLRIRNYAYFWNALHMCQDIFARSGGRVRFPDGPTSSA